MLAALEPSAELRQSVADIVDEQLRKFYPSKLEPKVIWQAIPWSSQEIAIDSRCNSTLYHGARGPGKTIVQLMRFRKNVGRGYGSYWRGVIFDIEFKNLSDLVAQSERFFTKFNDGAKFLRSASEYKWVWPTGEELLFRHVKKLKDYDNFHGHEYPFIGWNELTKQPNPDLYRKLMSTNRSSFIPELHTPSKPATVAHMHARLCPDGTYRIFETEDHNPLPDIPLEVFSTTNPSGVGHNWVKRELIDCSEPGEVVTKFYNVFNPRTQKDEIVKKTHVHIFGSWRENIYLSPEYIAELSAIKDPNLKRAWFYGDWSVTSGGALDDLWNENIHILPAGFKVPKEWKIDRGFDWGSTDPAAILWFAEANGEEMTLPDGRNFCPVAGSLIVVREWYICTEPGENKGLKYSAKKIAVGIKTREIEFMKNGYFKTQPEPGPADNQIRNVIDSSDDTTEKKMSDEGVKWTESDKSPGSNVVGLQVIRDMLESSVAGEGKALYVTRDCPNFIILVPPAPRDEEKPNEIDKNYEKHIYDTLKYRCLAGNTTLAKTINVTFA